MKKLLLSALAVGSALAMNAQGICNKSAYDDFKTTEEYSYLVDDNGTPDNFDDDTYKGIFWWQDEDVSTDFESSYTRAGNGKLVYTLHQEAKAYEPFGVGFGNDGPNGTGGDDFTVDLSDDANVSFTITNPATNDETIEVKVAIQDVNGITLGFDKSATVDGDLYLYEIGATSEGKYGTGFLNTGNVVKSIAPGESFDFSYDFKNATAVMYDENPTDANGCDNLPVYQCGDPATGTGDCFDYTQVKALTITVVNTDAGIYGTAAQCYSKDEFDGTVELTEVKIGDTEGECINGLFDFGVSANDFAVYPNPATDNVNFAKRLTNVEVYNAQGSLVETLGSANALNVASYEAGVYFIKATEGTSRVVVK